MEHIFRPNPASNYIIIHPSEGIKVQIFDILGIKVMSESIHPMSCITLIITLQRYA